MRKIINGHLFDTRRSELVAKFDSAVRLGHPDYWRESLYRSRLGYWFVAGVCDVFSAHALADNFYCFGRAYVRILSEAAALTWLAEHAPDRLTDISDPFSDFRLG